MTPDEFVVYVHMMMTRVDELPVDVLERPHWYAAAACRGVSVEMFVGSRGSPAGPAKRICAGCDVRGPCLEFALSDASITGTWGGTTKQERARMRRSSAA